MSDQDELSFEVEKSDDGLTISLIVSAPSGRKISVHDFIMCLEMYLHEVTQAELKRNEAGTLTH